MLIQTEVKLLQLRESFKEKISFHRTQGNTIKIHELLINITFELCSNHHRSEHDQKLHGQRTFMLCQNVMHYIY